MRTAVDIVEKLLAEGNESEMSPSKAVNTALHELVRREKLQGLKRLIKETTPAETWREDEDAELEEMRKQVL
jgi:hypothetical protein